MERKVAEAVLGPGRTQGEQSRVRQGSWIATAEAYHCLSVNDNELLLDQDNLSCSERVNFKLAETFLDFFTSSIKSLGLGSC